MANIETIEVDALNFAEVAAPATPSAASVITYAKADGLMYSKDDAGVETLMSGGAGGGAPTAATYLVRTLHASLSAEIATPHLTFYHPDNYPTSGTAAATDEFDDSSLHADWTWTTAPGGTVSETQFPGFLHIDGGTDASATVRYLRRAYTPGAATAFSVACKLGLGINNGNFDHRMGIVALDAADAVVAQAMYLGDGTVTTSDGYRLAYGTGPTVWATTVVPLSQSWIYLLFTRDASDVYNYYWSGNGMAWTFMGTATSATAVTKIGILYGSDTDAIGEEAVIDFVRVFTSVTRKIGA